MRSLVFVLGVTVGGCGERVEILDPERHCSDGMPTFCIEHVDWVRRDDHAVVWEVTVETGSVAIWFPYIYIGLEAYSSDDAGWLTNLHSGDIWIEFPDGSHSSGEPKTYLEAIVDDLSIWFGGMVFDSKTPALDIPAGGQRSFLINVRTDRLEAMSGDRLTVQVTNGYFEEGESTEGVSFLHHTQVESTIEF